MITQKSCGSVFFGKPQTAYTCFETWLKEGKIESWISIEHMAEMEDKKSHLHFYLKPAKRFDTVAARNSMCDEFGGALPFRSCDPYNWILYALHNPRYLAHKGEAKRFRYQITDLKSDLNVDQLTQLYNEAFSACCRLSNIESFLRQHSENGKSWREVILTGVIPPNQFLYWREYYQSI